MNDASLAAYEGWASAWSDTLWRASWQGGLFILAVALVCRLLPRIPPATRYWLWWLACLKLLTGWAGVALLTLPVLPAPREVVAEPTPPIPSHLTGGGTASVFSRGNPPSPPAPLPMLGEGSPSVRSSSPSPSIGRGGWGVRAGTHGQSKDPERRSWSERLTPLLFPAWLVGVAIQLALAARHGLAARRLWRSAQPLEHEETLEAARQLGARLGLRRLPPFVTSRLVRGPMVVGPLPTQVVLPITALETLSSTEVRLALAHELAHVRRGDCWLALVPGLARALFFFHPLAWLACREWATAREAACDAAALQATGAAPATYGRLLLKLAAANAGLAAAPGVGAAPSYHALRGRLLMLRTHSHRLRPWLRAGTTVVLVLAAITALPWRLTAQTVDGAVPASDLPLPLRGGRIHYRYTPPGATLAATFSWIEHGRKWRQEFRRPNGTTVWFAFDGKEFFGQPDPSARRILRWKPSSLPAMTAIPTFASPNEAGRRVGRVAILGQGCEIRHLERTGPIPYTQRTWLWHLLPLRQDWDGKRLWTATQIQTDPDLSPALFQVPPGFEVEEFHHAPGMGPVFNVADPAPSKGRNAAMTPSWNRFRTLVAGTTLAAVALSPNVARADETTTGDPSTRNLQKLATALLMYAQDYDQQLPPMEDAGSAKRVLLPYVRRDASVFVNPQTGEPYRINAGASGQRLATVVVYPGLKGRRERHRATIDPKRMPLIAAFYEATPAPDGTRAVLFLDGRAKRVREADWPRVKRESGIRE